MSPPAALGVPTGSAGEVVLGCVSLPDTLDFFRTRLGFRLDTIMPADDPAVAVLSGHGLRLRLERGPGGDPGRLRLVTAGPADRLVAPNGTVIDVVALETEMELPPLAPAFERAPQPASGNVGRAGMRYRDLLPSRQGGRFIASHITIPAGGPVCDDVHHHRIRFQLIYCIRGWVRLVYEDQGPPFVLEPGDCVLQPPGIRHRVLESSPGLEVLEVTCPAEHPTHLDHELALPTSSLRPDRDFDGQRFVRHRAATATWESWRADGFLARDTGIGAGTAGLAGVRVVRTAGDGVATTTAHHDADLLLWFVAAGTAVLQLDDRADEPLAAGDAVAIPAGLGLALVECSDDLELVEVSVPERPVWSPGNSL